MFSYQFIILASLISFAHSLAPNPTFEKGLQDHINPIGIVHVETPIDLTIPGTRGLQLDPSTKPEDYSIYTIGTSTATCDSEWQLDSTDPSSPKRESGNCVSLLPTDYFVQCHNDKNSNGEDDYIFISFGLNVNEFKAYGDAKAGFVPSSPGSTSITIPTNALTPAVGLPVPSSLPVTLPTNTTLPPVTLPTVPAVSTPPVALPAVTTPPVTLPPVSIPPVPVPNPLPNPLPAPAPPAPVVLEDEDTSFQPIGFVQISCPPFTPPPPPTATTSKRSLRFNRKIPI